MRSMFKNIIAVSALAATTIAVVQPAQARDHTGAAVAAGIIGVGVGAAIASDHRGYYGHPGYGYNYPAGYYAPAYGYGYGYPYGYYGGGYGYDHRGWGRDHWRGDRGHWDHRDGGWRR